MTWMKLAETRNFEIPNGTTVDLTALAGNYTTDMGWSHPENVKDLTVGQVAFVWSYGDWKRGVVTKIGRTKVTVTFVTRSGVDNARAGTGWGAGAQLKVTAKAEVVTGILVSSTPVTTAPSINQGAAPAPEANLAEADQLIQETEELIQETEERHPELTRENEPKSRYTLEKALAAVSMTPEETPAQKRNPTRAQGNAIRWVAQLDSTFPPRGDVLDKVETAGWVKVDNNGYAPLTWWVTPAGLIAIGRESDPVVIDRAHGEALAEDAKRYPVTRSASGRMVWVNNAPEETPDPAFPEGTPEHAAYRAELAEELGKFARREVPYRYEVLQSSGQWTVEDMMHAYPSYTVFAASGPGAEARARAECARRNAEDPRQHEMAPSGATLPNHRFFRGAEEDVCTAPSCGQRYGAAVHVMEDLPFRVGNWVKFPFSAMSFQVIEIERDSSYSALTGRISDASMARIVPVDIEHDRAPEWHPVSVLQPL